MRLVGNKVTVFPATSAAPDAAIVTAIIFESGATKYSSFPSARHRGCRPPPVDTCHLPPGTGNVCKTISKRPDSFVS